MKTARQAYVIANDLHMNRGAMMAFQYLEAWEAEVRADAIANHDCGHVQGVPRPMTKAATIRRSRKSKQ
jgi:hypothetical protein